MENGSLIPTHNSHHLMRIGAEVLKLELVLPSLLVTFQINLARRDKVPLPLLKREGPAGTVNNDSYFMEWSLLEFAAR